VEIEMKKETLSATTCFKSNLDIIKVGELLSNYLFGQLKFSGLEECIHEEVPAVYIDEMLMGLQVILDGDEENGYCLEIGFSPLASKNMQYNDEIAFAFFNRGFESYIRYLLMQLPDLTVQ